MRHLTKPVAIAGGIAALVAVTSTATATASNLIGSKDIQDGGVHRIDLGPRLQSNIGHGLTGAKFRVENYVNGGGGDATVACADTEAKSQKYTAIAGGVEAGHTGSNEFSVSASFPGRMDWSTGTPKAGRLDGWIILGNGKYTDNLKVWALCVPTVDIPVQQVNLDN